MTQLQDARARIAELEAAIEAEKDAQAAAVASVEPARKRKAALRARHAKTQLLTQAGGQPNSDGGGIASITLAMLHPSWARDFAGKRPKQAAESLVKGEAKMQAIGGIAYSLRGFLQRTRRVDKAIMRPVVVAERRRKRAQLMLREAWRAEREAYATAYEAGEKLMLPAVAAELAKRFVIDDNEPSIDQSIRDRAWEAKRDLPEAQQHLAWVKAKNPDKGVCPCRNCASDRQEAIRAKNEAERIAALPTVMFKCPLHEKRHRGPLDQTHLIDYQLGDALRAKLDETLPGWYAALHDPESPYDNRLIVPRVLCAKNQQWLVYTPLIEKAVKAAKPRKPRVVKLVEWRCPNPGCYLDGEAQQSEVEDGQLACDSCEVVYDATTLKLTPVKKAA